MVKQRVTHTGAMVLVGLLAMAGGHVAAQAQTPVTTNGLGTVAPAGSGQGGISVCATTLTNGPETALMVVPSGTVFEARAPAAKQGGQAFVTTETVTLTHMQPCGMADASTLVSHTRHWLVNPVKAPPETVFKPVGEVSGNGLDNAVGEETAGRRTAFKKWAIVAHVQGRLHETVYLTESAADIEDPDAPQKPEQAHLYQAPLLLRRWGCAGQHTLFWGGVGQILEEFAQHTR